MVTITDEEEKALRQLQEEHEAFWREQYPQYTPLKERLWDWISDHQTLMTVIVAVLLVIAGAVICSFSWLLMIAIVLFFGGIVVYLIGCMASGIVQWILDLLM